MGLNDAINASLHLKRRKVCRECLALMDDLTTEHKRREEAEAVMRSVENMYGPLKAYFEREYFAKHAKREGS